MDGKEAHSVILAAHASLRRMIAAIEPTVRREIESPGSVSTSLRAQTKDLAIALRLHIETEEQTLRPILRRLDAWGPERVERMIADHVRQRRLIADMLALANRRRGDAKMLAHAVFDFIEDVLADMAQEEDDVLAPLLEDGEVLVVRQHAE